VSAKFSGNVGAFNFWLPKLTQKLIMFNAFVALSD